MISVDQALEHLFALINPLDTEAVPIAEAAGRVLAVPVVSTRDQPPFSASVMDGYAVQTADIATGARLRVTGEIAAGHGGDLTLNAGEAIRIFTGAPVPKGADRVLIQEDTTRDGDWITVADGADTSVYIRPYGTDFRAGDTIDAPRRLSAHDIVLAAAMNAHTLTCTRRPVVALIATGDELVMPGENPRADQIIASNALGLAEIVRQAGGLPRLLPIARDREDALNTVFDLARGAEMVVTIGGASVGDHDLVGGVTRARGMEPSFYKVAMRPGKPLMAGMLDGAPMIGLPGNPVSSMVCGQVFLAPALRAMQGLPARPAPRQSGTLGADLGPNGPREHYMRARIEDGALHAFERQDSGLMGVLAAADALIIRPPGDGPRAKGSEVEYLPIAQAD
jgi:molybdopterin molybdotransferase